MFYSESRDQECCNPLRSLWYEKYGYQWSLFFQRTPNFCLVSSPLKQECFKSYAADGLPSYLTINFNIYNSSLPQLSKYSQNFLGYFLLNMILPQSGSLMIPGQLSVSGLPSKSEILTSCSISLAPVNKGTPLQISAKTQPTDQISTPVEYFLSPNSISGALYHLVKPSISNSPLATFSLISTADPKSHSFSCRSSVKSTFDGLMSLCNIPRL